MSNNKLTPETESNLRKIHELNNTLDAIQKNVKDQLNSTLKYNLRDRDNADLQSTIDDIFWNINIDIDAKILTVNEMLNAREQVIKTDLSIQQMDHEKTYLSDMFIDILNLSIKSHDCLRRNGINTVGELTDLSHDDLHELHTLTAKSIKEIYQVLENNNLSLKTGLSD